MNGPRILVVDDEPAVRRALRTNLIARGYSVAAVETSEEGLLAVAEQCPDLNILDLVLPGISGLALCQAVRAGSAVPILVLSARVEDLPSGGTSTASRPGTCGSSSTGGAGRSSAIPPIRDTA